ncbi:MFS transporter [Amycolatopsis taiwanensis]|uniref:MFS transporter n=1 Tax=Amycolatopsis taiwanensis TaxID=342230 RepID=UPI0004AD945F|nr:MFS transporter [Amycolatopsis taiwanensis]
MHTPGTAHPRRWWILGALCLSLLVLTIDNTVLNLAIPALMRDVGAGPAEIQWIVSAYTLSFAGLLLTAGGLSDRFGRKRLLLIGLGLFGAASLAASLAANPAQLIIGRAAMGVGGCLVMPSTLSILITVFDAAERRRAIAAWSSVSMAGVLAGPSLGGYLLDHFGWGSVFLINVPVAALAMLAALVFMPESTAPARKPDVPGVLLCTVAMVSIVWAIITAPDAGWGRPDTGGVLAFGLLVLAGFVGWELRAPHPMLPLRIFRDRDFSSGTLSVMLLAFAAAGMMLALTQYVQFVLGYPVFEAGMALLPFVASAAVCNLLGATLGRKLGNRTLVAAGMLVTAAGFAILRTIGPDSGYPLLGLALVIMGLGAGLATPAAVTALMGAIPPEYAGTGSAMNSTLSQTGSALGVATLGSLLAAGYSAGLAPEVPGTARASLADALATGDPRVIDAGRAAFTGAMSTTMLTGAVLSGVAAVVAITLLRKKTVKSTADTPPVGDGRPAERAAA